MLPSQARAKLIAYRVSRPGVPLQPCISGLDQFSNLVSYSRTEHYSVVCMQWEHLCSTHHRVHSEYHAGNNLTLRMRKGERRNSCAPVDQLTPSQGQEVRIEFIQPKNMD